MILIHDKHLILTRWIICLFTKFCFPTDQQMDEKERNDPLNNVPIIKGNPKI